MQLKHDFECWQCKIIWKSGSDQAEAPSSNLVRQFSDPNDCDPTFRLAFLSSIVSSSAPRSPDTMSEPWVWKSGGSDHAELEKERKQHAWERREELIADLYWANGVTPPPDQDLKAYRE